MKKLLDDRRVLLPVLLTAVVIAVGSLLIVVLSDDASGGGSQSAGPATSAGAGAVKVDISDFKYAPETVTVKAGSKVTWVNGDSAPHTATAAGVFDTDKLDKGDSKAVTLSKPGSYTYTCSFHAFMKGTVVVK